MEEVSEEQIEELDKLWHKVIQYYQSNEQGGFTGRLEGVTTVEVSILNMVAKRPDVIMREISKGLDIPSSTLTSAVDRLEERGFLKRVISQRDRRSFGLELTEEGVLAQNEHKKQEQELFKKMLTALDSEEERVTFINLAYKIVAEFIDD